MTKEELKIYLFTSFGHCIIEDTNDFIVLHVNKSEIFNIAEKLKNGENTRFDFLFCQTAIDNLSNFEVVYYLKSTIYQHTLVLKVILEDREKAEIDSVVPLWKAAELYECEIYDLFGILFKGHPTLRRIFLGDDWHGFPLRKDYNEINEMPS